MIDMNKIPGFEKTPDIKEKLFCTKIYKMVKLPTMNMKKKTAIFLKKLLDERRKLLELILEGEMLGNDKKRNYYKYALKKKETVERITCKTWEELTNE